MIDELARSYIDINHKNIIVLWLITILNSLGLVLLITE